MSTAGLAAVSGRPGRPRAADGFTLVELLVVITIIGVLVAMLLPAVGSARESARRTQCANHLKQLGLACLAHDQAHGYLPSGGWGYMWVGDPALGYGAAQPGGWLYSALPHLDQETLYKLGGSDGVNVTATQLAGAAQCIGTPLAVMNCPTRRRAAAYPSGWPGYGFSNGSYVPRNAAPAANVARGDYAANVGDEFDAAIQWEGPASMADGLAQARASWPGYEHNGVVFTGSMVAAADVRDGTSNTYLLGEKYLAPDHYFNGLDGADNESMYSGCENDNNRTTYYLAPLRDRTGLWIYDSFGSAHPFGCGFVFCDGSVHWINYGIDMQTHHRLGNRHDGQVVDGSKF